MRHLEDHDKLKSYGFDAPVIAGQHRAIALIGDTLLARIQQKHLRQLVFLCSPKRRTTQTAEHVCTYLRKYTQTPILILIKTNLDTICQGALVLPDEYQDGTVCHGLRASREIFKQERYHRDDPARDNILYRVGDPITLPDGTYTYPELLSHFSAFGESTRDFFVRIYREIVHLHTEQHQYSPDTEYVLFTHNQVFEVIRDMQTLSERTLRDSLRIVTGSIPRSCLDLSHEVVEQRVNTQSDKDSFGRVDILPVYELLSDTVINMLKKEIAHLASL